MENSISNEELLGPPKTDLVSVGLATLGSAIAGFIGGLIIIVATYFFIGKTGASSGAFPFVLSLLGFFSITTTVFLTLSMNRLLFPDKYPYGTTLFSQVTLFSIILYACITPLYLYVGTTAPDSSIFVFVVHLLLGIFGFSLISEILSNYRYILLAVYGSFIGFIVVALLSVLFFLNYTTSNTALYSLMGVIVVANVVITLARSLFELLYYRYYLLSGQDRLGDIFHRIEQEEREIIEKAQEELEKF